MPPVTIGCYPGTPDLDGHLSLLYSESNISPETAKAALLAGEFSPTPYDVIKIGNSYTSVWVYMRFENLCDSPVSLTLRLKNSGIYRAALFNIRDSLQEHITTWEKGRYTVKLPNLPENSAPIFPITLSEKEESGYLLQVQKEMGQPGFSVKLFDQNSLFKTCTVELISDGALFGLFLFVLAFNLFLYISLKDKIYLVYAGFVGISVLFYLTLTGYGRLFLWKNNTLFDEYATSIFVMGWLYFFVQFAQSFTGQTAKDGWLYYINSFFKRLCVLNLVLLLYYFHSEKTISDVLSGWFLISYSSAEVLSMFPVYLTVFKKAREGDAPAKFYLIANAVYGLVLLVDALNRWDIIRIHHLLTFSVIPAGMTIEVVLLSYGLSLRYHQFKHYNDQLKSILFQKEKALSAAIIQTQNHERNRIAQDLHDDLGGIIATLGSGLSSLSAQTNDPLLRGEMEKSLGITRKAGERIRQIAHNLMPPEFEKAGLAESLKEYVQAIDSPAFSFSVFGKEQRFAPERELNTYRLVSELVQNIRKHAGASRASLQVFYHEEMISIVIEDDGRENKERTTAAAGIGQASISARTAYLQANLLTDITEQGTTLILEVPYNKA